jgi:hypothetical protein
MKEGNGIEEAIKLLDVYVRPQMNKLLVVGEFLLETRGENKGHFGELPYFLTDGLMGILEDATTAFTDVYDQIKDMVGEK